jgi:uncharacterized RDD family membrane protein YckC
VTEQYNPYSPPKARVDGGDEPRELNVAGKGRRFGTFLIDYLISSVFVFVVTFVLALTLGESAITALEGVPGLLVGLPLMFAYYVGFESLWGRTPGKFVCGTIVVTDEGGTPTFRTIAVRTLCRFIPFEPFSFFGDRGWHDKFSKTQVVMVRA